MKFIKLNIYTCLLLSLTTSHAATNWFLGGDALNNTLTTGWDNSSSSTGIANSTASWTGGGTIQNVVIAPTGVNGDDNVTNTVIDNAPSGTISGIEMSTSGTTFDINFQLIPADSNLPATADFEVRSVNTGSSQNRQGGQGFSFTDFQNVAELHVTSVYSEALAAKIGGSSRVRAWGFAMRNLITPVAYDMSMTLPDLITLTENPITNDPLINGTDFVVGTAPASWFTSGTASGIPALINELTDPSLFTLSGGAIPSITASIPLASNNDDWIGIEGIDYNGDGDVYDSDRDTTTSDEALAQFSYLHTVDWTIREPDGNAFDSTTSFNFSMDGAQYDDTLVNALEALDVVPEPSSSILCGLGGLLLLSRRRR